MQISTKGNVLPPACGSILSDKKLSNCYFVSVCMSYRHLQVSLVYHHRLPLPEAWSQGPARRELWSYKSSAWIVLCTSPGWIMPSPHTWQHLPGQWRAPGKNIFVFMKMGVEEWETTLLNVVWMLVKSQTSHDTSLLKTSSPHTFPLQILRPAGTPSPLALPSL